MPDFTGRWFTTFGPMTLTQDGAQVTGEYGPPGIGAKLSGTVEGIVFSFEYEEPAERGQGVFELARPGKFAGRYLAEGAAQWRPWDGQRGFDGIWESSFGRLRLIQEEERVVGFYEGLGSSTIQGSLQDGRLVFNYQEPAARGEGWFDLSPDGLQFAGEWRPDTAEMWGQWLGRRVLPEPGLTWLMVLEAHWQTSLADNEYAFGNMLREVFARLTSVKVRQRFFQDEHSLARWCRELLYVAEPTILMIASHGSPQGLTVHGQTIDTAKVLDSVRQADNLKLLHFSSCLVAQDGESVIQSQVNTLSFPISGYTTSVDWGGSALVEFTYLDMILNKGLTPAQAAELLPRVIAFAGDDAPEGSPYPPLGFRFFAKN